MVADDVLFHQIVDCVDSTPNFARMFMNDKFERPFAHQHKAIFDALDDPDEQRVLVLAPRGSGKTTDALACATRHILFGLKKFLMMVGASEGMMIPKTEDMKTILQDSEFILPLFGKMHSEDGIIIPRRSSRVEWETTSGITVWSKGAGQRIRGALVHFQRPDFIILDDLENDENVDNPDWRAKVRDFVTNVVEMMVDVSSGDYKIVYLATMLHHDCYPARIVEDAERAIAAGRKPKWKVVRFDLCDEECNSMWPEFMTTEQIIAEKEWARSQGNREWATGIGNGVISLLLRRRTSPRRCSSITMIRLMKMQCRKER